MFPLLVITVNRYSSEVMRSATQPNSIRSMRDTKKKCCLFHPNGCQMNAMLITLMIYFNISKDYVNFRTFPLPFEGTKGITIKV